MNQYIKCTDRNKDIITFFYTLFGKRLRSGMNPDEARREAYDGTTLRYGVSRRHIINIISAIGPSQNANKSAFRQDALALVKELELINQHLDEEKAKNSRLIELLEEVAND